MKRNNLHKSCLDCGLRNHTIFCEIRDHDAYNLNTGKIRYHYKKGEIIFHEGSIPSGLWVVESGKVKIYKSSGQGQDQITRMTGPGDVIGYKALLRSSGYAVSAEVLEDASLCYIPKDLFYEMMKHNTSIYQELTKVMSMEISQKEQQMTSMAYKPVKARLAEIILLIKEKYGFEADNKTIRLSLSRIDLSNLVGTATETLIRNLAILKEEHLIELHGKKITILDQQGLMQAALLK
ncbi:MAG: Crp/Fnr family transcriptional regulator [Bacteroidia bacterium]|nr:Crp/Fnr family transcriptional regulator [Bacteroidia bacterium]